MKDFYMKEEIKNSNDKQTIYKTMLSYCLKCKKNTETIVGDKLMPEIHLRQPGLTYSAGGPFKKNKERIQKFKETRDLRYIYQKELDKACFQHGMTYGDFKDLNRRTLAEVLRDKAFNIAKDPKYDGYQRRHASMVYKCFDKKTYGSGIKKENISNKELVEGLNKPIIRKFNKRKLHSPFIDNI